MDDVILDFVLKGDKFVNNVIHLQLEFRYFFFLRFPIWMEIMYATHNSFTIFPWVSLMISLNFSYNCHVNMPYPS